MSDDFLSDYIAKLEADNMCLRTDLAAARTEIARLRAELEPIKGVLDGVAKTYMNPLDVVSISAVDP